MEYLSDAQIDDLKGLLYDDTRKSIQDLCRQAKLSSKWHRALEEFSSIEQEMRSAKEFSLGTLPLKADESSLYLANRIKTVLESANRGCCFDCGIPYASPRFRDFNIPRDIWEQISPSEGGGGLLCANCICARLEAAGFDRVPGEFTSGPCANGDSEKLGTCRHCKDPVYTGQQSRRMAHDDCDQAHEFASRRHRISQAVAEVFMRKKLRLLAEELRERPWHLNPIQVAERIEAAVNARLEADK